MWLPGSGIFGYSWYCGDDSRHYSGLLWCAYPFSSWSKKSHPGFVLTSQAWSDPHPHEWMVCLRVRAAVYFLQSRILSFCHSPLAYWRSSSSSVLQHNSQWQWLRQFELWTKWVTMAGKRDGRRHSPGLLGGVCLWLGNVGDIGGEQHRAKAGSMWYSSGSKLFHQY